jgi:succinate dehydrogenase / fumarate reductase, cytochrome b subunit
LGKIWSLHRFLKVMDMGPKDLVKPLSPFMHYRKGHTMTLSILHRITGIALTVGSALLVYGLVAAASGPSAYASAQSVFACSVVKLALIGWVFAFSYHFLNGIRHLVWDTGRGFDLAVARKSGYAVLIAALLVTAMICWVFARGGAA